LSFLRHSILVFDFSFSAARFKRGSTLAQSSSRGLGPRPVGRIRGTSASAPPPGVRPAWCRASALCMSRPDNRREFPARFEAVEGRIEAAPFRREWQADLRPRRCILVSSASTWCVPGRSRLIPSRYSASASETALPEHRVLPQAHRGLPRRQRDRLRPPGGGLRRPSWALQWLRSSERACGMVDVASEGSVFSARGPRNRTPLTAVLCSRPLIPYNKVMVRSPEFQAAQGPGPDPHHLLDLCQLAWISRTGPASIISASRRALATSENQRRQSQTVTHRP